MTDLMSPLIFGLVTLLSVIFYPQHVYTKTRGETALLTSSCWGAHLGTWLSWKLGHISNLPHQYSDASLSASVHLFSFSFSRKKSLINYFLIHTESSLVKEAKLTLILHM